jgi:L-fucose/D-arabinose isomerase
MLRKAIAVVTLGDVRKEFFEKRTWIVEEENNKLRNLLSESYDLYMPSPISSVHEAQLESEIIRSKGIVVVIIHIPIWGTPSHAEPLTSSAPYPVILLGNSRNDSSSMVSLLATAGMLEQSGKQIQRIFGNLEHMILKKRLFESIKLCFLLHSLKNNRFCLIGGQSIGIGTTVADPAQWQRIWGICSDHRDQLEVYMLAENQDKKRVSIYRSWLETLGGIQFGNLFTEKSLDKQIRSYLAIKDIVKQGEYSFLALKCQQELSDWYALQCLSIALLNNPFDAEGIKQVVPCSCEGDCDGALTMQILHSLDTSQPSCLVDIRSYDEASKEFLFANCGGMALGYANPADNIDAKQKTIMMPHMFGKAGGGTIQFMTDGGFVTVARLFRKNGKYCMAVFEGESISKPRSSLTTNICYPHAFINADIDFEIFMQRMGSNHMHFIYGNYAKILQNFCALSGIEYIDFSKTP